MKLDLTVNQKLDSFREQTTNGCITFYKPFTKCDLSNFEELFLYKEFIKDNLMISKSLEEFIERCFKDKQNAQNKLKFPDSFDYVTHCIRTAQIDAKGKKIYNFIFANNDLIKHYVNKCSVKHLGEVVSFLKK